MKLIKLSAMTLVFGLISMPLMANASNLRIANDSNTDFTFSINGACQTQTIQQHTFNFIPEKVFTDYCVDAKNCFVDVYKQPSCAGSKVETIGYDIDHGVMSLEGGDQDPDGSYYYWAADGFELYVSNH